MKLVLPFVLTCLFVVNTSEASNYLDSLYEKLLQRCPWLTESTVVENEDGLGRCLMTFSVEDLKKMQDVRKKLEEKFQARAKGDSQVTATLYMIAMAIISNLAAAAAAPAA